MRLADGSWPNVLLLSIDTLRADHLGYVRSGPNDLTPFLDALIASGTAFTEASTPAPTTRTATAALMTGAYRGVHGVRGNGWPLGRRVPVLAEELRRAGYRTAAFYGNRILRPEDGFGRGFDSYESFAVGRRRVSADEIGVQRAVRWLETGPPSPWFLWVHLMDPHGPYDSAPPSVLDSIDPRDPRPDRRLRRSPTNTGLGVLPRYQQISGVQRASAYRRRYRAEVRHSDAQVGKLLRALDALGLADRTLVVFTADHGEGLGDHDYYFQHGWLADQGSIAVPLAFRLPGRVGAGRRIEKPVSLVDVAPTVLGGLGLEPPASMEGRDLSEALAARGAGPVLPQPVYSASTLLSGITSVRLGRWKLVHTPPPPPVGEDHPWAPYFERQESFRLFDVRRDPGETEDLASRYPGRTKRLRRLLEAWEARHMVLRPGGAPGVGPDLRDALRALGYAD